MSETAATTEQTAAETQTTTAETQEQQTGTLLGTQPTDQQKTEAADEKPAEEQKTEEQKTEAPPEFKFEDLKLPENYIVSDEMKDKISAIAKEKTLSADTLQPLLDLHNEQIALMQKAQSDAWATLNEKWLGEVKAMPEFSGEKLVAAQATVAKALDEYGTPEARQAFDLTGAGNNPAIFRLIHNMAKALSEGTSTTGGNPVAKQQGSIEDVFYPSMRKN